jgi:serine/threonine protein kinase
MGEVYRAKDTRLDRTVALEVLPQHLAADPGLRERFEREARAVSSLNHPHIGRLLPLLARRWQRDLPPGARRDPDGGRDHPLTIVLNWPAGLKK